MVVGCFYFLAFWIVEKKKKKKQSWKYKTMFGQRLFYYFVKNWKPSKTKKKIANFFCKSVVCVFLLHLFQKNFSPKLGQKLLRRKMVLKKFTFYFFLQSRYSLLDWICFLNFFSLICLFFYRFLPYAQPQNWSVVEKQNHKPNDEIEKQGTTNCWNTNFPTLKFLNI